MEFEFNENTNCLHIVFDVTNPDVILELLKFNEKQFLNDEYFTYLLKLGLIYRKYTLEILKCFGHENF